MYSLAFPWVWLLLPLPLLIWALPRVRRASLTTIRAPFLDQLLATKGQQKNHKSLWLNGLPWLLLLLAASRPQWVGEPVPLPVEGRDLMLAIDISGSMEIKDMRINNQAVDRLTAVKQVAGDFIDRRTGDRIGLILFGENAYLQTPMTFDRATVKTLLNEAAIGLAGKSTAIGDSIGLAVKKIRETENNNRILIVLTDGQNTAGAINPLKASELARDEEIKIYTIGVGAEEMIENTIFGQRRTNPSADLDEATLRRIATITEGQYFRARDIDELEDIYALLDELEPLAEEETILPPHQRIVCVAHAWPLVVAVHDPVVEADAMMELNWTEFHFLRPHVLWLLIPALWLLARWINRRSRQDGWQQACDPELLQAMQVNTASGGTRWTGLYWPIVILGILALAGPAVRQLPMPVIKNQAALVVALDVSKSMWSDDLKPSRLQRAKFAIQDLLNERKDGQTALIVYSGDAFVVTPLTDDADTIIALLDVLDPSIMPVTGTNTVAALDKAENLLQTSRCAEWATVADHRQHQLV